MAHAHFLVSEEQAEVATRRANIGCELGSFGQARLVSRALVGQIDESRHGFENTRHRLGVLRHRFEGGNGDRPAPIEFIIEERTLGDLSGRELGLGDDKHVGDQAFACSLEDHFDRRVAAVDALADDAGGGANRQGDRAGRLGLVVLQVEETEAERRLAMHPSRCEISDDRFGVGGHADVR